MHNKEFKIATWNVRSMYQTGKLDNVELEAKRLDLDILGISDVRWSGSNKIAREEFDFIFSGGDKHKYGVGMLVKKKFSSMIKNIIPMSDRVIGIQIEARPKPITIIQVYAPTADKEDEEVEKLYEEIEKVKKELRRDGPVIIMGDFNAKVGSSPVNNTVGAFGLGEGNERGSRLIEFAEKHDMVIGNTLFKQHPRRLFTWKSPGDRVRNQIDYIMINRRYRNAMLNCHTYPSADCGTDHIMLVAKCRITLAKCRSRKKHSMERIYISPLKNKRIAHELANELDRSMEQIQEGNEVNKMWCEWKKTVIETTKSVLKEKPREKKKEVWMTNKILDMMDHRRQIKNRNSDEYKVANREIQRQCREAKNKWYENKCNYIQQLEENGEIRKMHQEVKWLMKQQRRSYSKIAIFEDEDGKLHTEEDKMELLWNNYIQELYGDSHRGEVVTGENQLDEAPEISMDELSAAIQSAKQRKAVGVDSIPVEIIKVAGRKVRHNLLILLNKIYKTGEIPNDFQISTFIPLPKKKGARKCVDHRTISIMSHVLKLLLFIVNRRLEGKIDKYLSQTQFGFIPKKGTRDAIALFKVIMQRALAMNRKLYICFVDYEKAFDRVLHNKLIEMLMQFNVDREDVQLIKNLYWKQMANVRIGGHNTKSTCEIQKGVRQGCPLSPRLFNMYAEMIAQKCTLRNVGFKINGERFESISYADDKMLIAETPHKLQLMVSALDSVSKKYNMKINCKKTKVMKIERFKDNKPLRIEIEGTQLQQVDSFKYLGSTVTDDGKDDQEIRIRIAAARNAFNNIERVLRDRSIHMCLRLKILNCYVWSVMRYASECWTINKDTERRINAFELWCYRRIKRIKWIDRITNTEVLQRIGISQLKLLDWIRRNKREFIEDKRKNDRLFATACAGVIVGKSPRGRKRKSILSDT